MEGFGEDLFAVLQEEPQRVQDLIPQARAENVLEQWKADFDRRTRHGGEKAPDRGDRSNREQRGPRGRGGEGRQRESGEARRGRGGRGRRGERGPNEARREQPERSGERAPETRSKPIPQAPVADGEADPYVPAPVSSAPVERGEAQESSQAEQPAHAASSVPASPRSGAADAATESRAGDDLEGLEPSRLHTRTSRRGGRR